MCSIVHLLAICSMLYPGLGSFESWKSKTFLITVKEQKIERAVHNYIKKELNFGQGNFSIDIASCENILLACHTFCTDNNVCLTEWQFLFPHD